MTDEAFICDCLSLVYLVILQIVGIILAYKTRGVKIGIMNESKFVAAFIGVTSIIYNIVAIVNINFELTNYVDASGSIFSGGIMLLATISLALTFIPKVCQ